MTSIRKSIALTFTGRYVGLVLGVTSNVILARLLLPEELGIYSIGAAVLAFIHVFRDFGASQYLIREPELTPEKIRTCFGLSFGIAWVMGFGVVLLTKPITDFYNEPALGPVIFVMIGALLIVPFNAIRMGLLRRNMQFGTLMYVEVASAGANAVVAVTLAALGYGPLSLAFGVLGSILATYIIFSLTKIETDIWPPSLKEWRSVANFGTKSLGLSLLNQTSERAPEIIVGRVVGLHDTGILSRANGLVNLFTVMITQSIYSVAFPAVAERHRKGMAVGSDYVKMVCYVSALAFPFFSFIFILALPFIRFLFGPNWDESAPLTEILCVVGFLAPYTAFNAAFYIAIGRIETDLRISAVFTPLKVLCWLLAAPYGLLFALKVFVSIYFINVVVSVLFLQRALKFSWLEFTSSNAKSFAVMVLSSIPPLLVAQSGLIANWGDFLALFFAAGTMFVIWLISIFIFKHPFRGELILIVGHLRTRFRSRGETDRA